MGCGCRNKSRGLTTNQPTKKEYEDVVGYMVKDEKGNSLRIFAKNVQKILD
jgi:hypothetical protein